MINELHDGMLAGHSNDVLGDVLHRLVNYTIVHFQNEERLFAQTSYPGAVAHKLEHDKLKQQVAAVVQDFRAGSNSVLSMDTLKFLRDWLKHHILESDKAYGPYLNRHGVH